MRYCPLKGYDWNSAAAQTIPWGEPYEGQFRNLKKRPSGTLNDSPRQMRKSRTNVPKLTSITPRS